MKKQTLFRTLRATLSAIALAGMLTAGAASAQQEVQIFEGAPPSAEAMADMLYPEQPKTRGIVLTNQPAPEPMSFGFLIQFGFDSADVLPESRSYLDEVAAMLALDKMDGKAITVEGHADAVGGDAYNLDLSRRRAEAVSRYLVEAHQVDPSRVRTVGKGESEPLSGKAPTDPMNRRVQFSPAS